MKKNATYALFGGSFDPPHKGHQKIVKSLLQLEEIDAVFIVPTYQNPFKKGFHATPKQRLEWCTKLFKSSNIKVIDYEINLNRAVYTIETYEYLSKKYNITAIVIGADNIKNIREWKDFTKLNNSVKWIVASRPNEPLDCTALREFTILPLETDISSSEIRRGEKLEYIDESIRKQVLKVYNSRNIQDNR